MNAYTIPDVMQQIQVDTPGGPDAMVPVTAPTPVPAEDEVLIQVAAAGVNRPDVAQRQGQYPPPPGASPILGLEVAGAVVALGERVTDCKTGDRVCALVNGGGYAQYCVAPATQCLPVPHPLSLTEAAALPKTFFTVRSNVFHCGRASEGETLLVHGGSSGIGTTATQLGRAFGLQVFVTAGSPVKCKACLGLGATAAINYREQDFVGEVKRLTGGRGVDVILDMVGGPYLPRNMEALAPDGRLVQIAFLQGSRVELDLRPILTKRLTLTGSTLRPRTAAEKGRIADALRRHVWPLLEAGQMRPVMDRTYPLAEATAAHARMEAGDHIGKIVLTFGP